MEKNRCYAHWKQRLWYFHREKVKRRGRNFFLSLSTRVSRSRFRYLGFAFDDRDPFFTRPLRFSSIIGAALEPIDGRSTAPTPPSSITFHQRTLCLGGEGARRRAIKSRTDIGIRGNLQRIPRDLFLATCFANFNWMSAAPSFYPPRKIRLETKFAWRKE